MPKIKAVYQLKDNSLHSGELREMVVDADSAHKGEVEMAIAEKHDTSYFNVNVVSIQVAK
jgi:hypothetical protein